MLFGSHAGNDVIPKMFDVLEQVLVRGTGRDNPKFCCQAETKLCSPRWDQEKLCHSESEKKLSSF